MVNLFLADMSPCHKFKSWDDFYRFCKDSKFTHVEVGEWIVVLGVDISLGIPHLAYFAQEEK